ncbi:MAG: hypothetical protein MK100_06155 [Phycisphaerales bacterium]|nr:hypothetical protein [Phycisphaerales bacterium]
MNHLSYIPLAAALMITMPTQAEWSNDPTINTLISGIQSGCAITHAAQSLDGSVWVAWYDSDAGYDIVLQLIDEDGNTAFEPPIVVSDQSLSWVQDFDLSIDGEGNAAIAWSDGDSTGAARVLRSGEIAFVREFSAGGAFTANAQICKGPEGSLIVAWGEDGISRAQRLSPEGDTMWLNPPTFGGSGTTAISDLHPSIDGDTLASFVTYTSFSGPKRLVAARITHSGSIAWGLNDVFTNGSLQFGAYPEFIRDNSGGGIFVWYSTSPLMARAQWMTETGDRLLGTDGMAMTTETNMVHVGAVATYELTEDVATVYWTRQDSLQSQAGVQVNRINRNGDRLLGNTGLQVAAMSANSVLDLSAWQLNELACAAWIGAQNTGPGMIYAAAIDPEGTLPWNTLGPARLGTPNIDRSDLSSAASNGQGIVVWVDARDGSDRAYAQNINSNGTLGGAPCTGDISGDGTVGVDDILSVIESWGSADAAADLDGNGIVDTNDLLIILAGWGPC